MAIKNPEPTANAASGKEFPPFAVTVDLVVLAVTPPIVNVLLVRRTGDPYIDQWALPGGFVGPEQGLAEAARYKLDAKTGLDLDQAHIEQLATFGRPDRDPRMRTVSIVYLALVAEPYEPALGPELPAARWVNVSEALSTPLAFDHNEILSTGFARLQAKLEYSTLATTFCGPTFTVATLRTVYESIWGTKLDPANFYRKILASPGFVEATDEMVSTGKGRPAKVYRRGFAELLTSPIQRP